MARQVDYECMNCGYELSSVDEIFWIDDGLDIHIEPLLMTTSAISSEAPVKGYFTRYYCYDCRKFISKFVIFKNSNEISDENIITLIEQYDDSAKIIQFDDVFQKCLECGSDLASKADYSFVLDENDEFHIGESVIDFPESESNKFAGEYHGFFCSQCKKQINKFVITQNNANFTDDEIKAVLKEHTNDLTIFIRRDYDLCPICGEEIYYLHENSTCPSCMEERLTITNITMMD